MKLHKIIHLLVLTTSISCCLSITGEVKGQGKQAIVVLRPTAANSTGGCEGGAELASRVIFDVRLNAKEEVRLFNDSPRSVSREAYERSVKTKLRDLYSLKWGRDDVLYAISIAGQSPIVAVPDNLKPQKNVVGELSSFYSVMISGEERDGKQKRKVDVPLRSVWKIYFLAEGAAVNDTLFNHAAEEASVALWETYLQKTNNYRANEANAKMRDALIVCSHGDLGRFLGGDYRSLDKARQKGARAQSVKDDDASRQLLTDIRNAQQQVEDTRVKAEQLIKAEKWDEAIDATEPIKKYLETWPDLDQMYKHSLEQSHEIHLNAGNKELLGNQLEAALKDCSIARSRLPNSDGALMCVCKARTEIALREQNKERKISRPKEGKEILEQQIADSECKPDPRLAAELKGSKCEYKEQLYTQARQLLGVGTAAAPAPRQGRRRGSAAPATPAASNLVNVKVINMQNKKDFRDAREKLMLANELCPDDVVGSLLTATNDRLSDFCVAEAKSALQKNNDGTAYVYLQSAQIYTPGNANVSSMLSEARERFQQRTRVSIGTAFETSVRSEAAGVVLSEVNDAIRSAATESGLAQPAILDDEQSSAAWRAMQGGRALDSPTVIFTGTLLAANLDVSANPRTVSSSYSFENTKWKEADRVHDARNEQYKSCRKQYGDAACGQLKSQVDQLRAYRDQFPRTITERYSYRENVIRMSGGARMSLRPNDSISRSVRNTENLQAGDQWQCVERSGVNPQDYSARDSSCPEPDRSAFFGGIVLKIKRDARLAAVAQLRDLPLSYYTRAQSTPNRQQSVEDYLRFVFLTRDKSGSEAQQAKSFLLAYDPELATDGILR